MITVFLRGGLGNQMFQYAVGLAVARKNGTSLVLDRTHLNDRFPRKQFTYRTYDLDIFDMRPKMTLLSNVSTAVPIPGVWLGLDLAAAGAKDILGTQKIVKEQRDYVFEPAVLDSGKSVFLYGRWQVPNYFKEVEQELRNDFRFKYPLDGEAAAIAKDIKKNNSVSLHVRRADYVIPKYEKTYGATNLSYYDCAVRSMANAVKDPKFYIFSDDIAWCKENVKLPFPAEYVERNSEGPKASHHLQLMSLCKHNIIANSTFSWWGAWLNQTSGKRVIAPAVWHAGDQSSEESIIPAEWEKI